MVQWPDGRVGDASPPSLHSEGATETAEYDMHYCTEQATRKPEGKFWDKAAEKTVIYGMYQLSATLHRTKVGGRYHIRLHNDWNKDHEPGFPFSNQVP